MSEDNQDAAQHKNIIGHIAGCGILGCLGMSYLGLLLIVIITFVLSLQDIDNAYGSKSWPTAPGIITSSVVTSDKVRRDSTGKNFRRTRTVIVYGAKVKYKYSVNDREYEGDRVSFGLHDESQAVAESIVRRYPKNKKVSVLYNPDNPAECTLETGATTGSFIGSGTLGAILFFMLLIPITFFARKIKKK